MSDLVNVAGYLVQPNGRPLCPGVYCKCDVAASFCPMHGMYTPGVADQEIVAAVAEASRSSRFARRVIRKHPEN